MSLDRPTHRTPLTDGLRAELAPLLQRIAAGALRREVEGELPVEPVRWLKQAGFGALRVPVEHGGRGIGLTDLTQLWIDLAAADANLPQALRGHATFVEDRLVQHARGLDQSSWFGRFVAGELVGNAWAEVGSSPLGQPRTVLTRSGDHYRLDGTKFYTTGSIYAEWADVYVRRVAEDDVAVAVVDLREAGVSVVDDWDGFGQRGTGSGTTTFVDVVVDPENVLPFGERFPYQTALYQLNLLATLVGIGRAAVRDTVDQVRGRERNFSHANAARVRDDAQVLARVGDIAAAVYAAEAATLRVASALQEVHDAVVAPSTPAREADLLALNESAEIESSAAQVVVSELVLRATSDLFDTLGASATSRGKALDRHWRNARTVASHNPRILKSRVVGGYLVNGTPPPYAWAVGATDRVRSAVGA
ncbi:MAG: acyl-CoA dehydrogenase family protein [Nocardioides sp.]